MLGAIRAFELGGIFIVFQNVKVGPTEEDEILI
jgi:hypothetical protein